MGRINSYPEASSYLSDDYLIIDGDSNGTRKINPLKIAPVDSIPTKNSSNAVNSGSVYTRFEEINKNLTGFRNNDYSKKEIDTGSWALGSVSSTGIKPSETRETHSDFFEIGSYDYVDVLLTDQTCKFIVYRYDGVNFSTTPELKAVYVVQGGIRLFDKSYKYILRVASVPYSTISDPNVYKDSIKVYGGTYKNVCYVEDIRNIVKHSVFDSELDVPFALVGVTSSGYEANGHNATTVPFAIGNYDYITFEAIDTGSSAGDCYYSVYAYDGSTYTLVSGGWTEQSLTFSDKTVRYVLRIALRNVTTTFTAEQFEKACGAIKIHGCIKTQDKTSVYGYERHYVDISNDLTFEQKSISTTGIEDSTVSLLAKLPKSGNIECRLNRPVGKFSVWKSTNGTFTCLTNGWTFYQYRYTGDYDSDYYIAIATPDETTITMSYYNVVSVYKFVDVGAHYIENPLLSGKNIAVFGDSIVQGRMIKNASSVNCTMPKPYSNLLSEVAGTEPHNFGIGGATVYDKNWKSLSRNYIYVTGFDVVFVCAGTNDFGSSISLEDFRTAYDLVISELVETNTKVVVCTPTRRGTNGTVNGNTLQDFVDIEIEIAQTYELNVIDLYSLTNSSVFKNHLPDNLHPNEIGARMIADIILSNYE